MKKILSFIFIFSILITENHNSFALGTRDTGYQAAAYSTVMRVTSSLTCRYVIRNGSSSVFFIPTKDWSQFNSIENHPNLSIRACDVRSIGTWSRCYYNSTTSKGCGGYMMRSVTCPSGYCNPRNVPASTATCRVTNNTYDYNRCSSWKAYPGDACSRPCHKTYSSTANGRVKYNSDCYGDCDTNSPTYLVR